MTEHSRVEIFMQRRHQHSINLRCHAGNVRDQRHIFFTASTNFNRKRTASTDEQPDWPLVVRKTLAEIVGLDLWIVSAQFSLVENKNMLALLQRLIQGQSIIRNGKRPKAALTPLHGWRAGEPIK